MITVEDIIIKIDYLNENNLINYNDYSDLHYMITSYHAHNEQCFKEYVESSIQKLENIYKQPKASLEGSIILIKQY